MPEVRRRRVADDEERPVRRRRDRVEEVDEDEAEDEDVDATERPVRARKTAGRTTKKRATTRRRPEPEPEEEDDEEEPEDEDDYEEEEEDEAPPPRRRKKAAAAKKAAPRRRRAPEPEDDDEDDDDEPAPRPRARKAAGTKKRAAASPLHSGIKGAEHIAKASGGGATRLTLSQQPELIKVLEPEPLTSFMQHWMPGGPGQGDRPYVCLEVDCPLCEIANRPSKTTVFNVLHLPEDARPQNKVLQISVKAYKAFASAATPRGKEKPAFDRDFWAVSRSGTGQQSQINFSPIKERDLEEDWADIFEQFDEELEDLIADAQDKIFEDNIIQIHTAKQLREIARYAAVDDEE